MPRTASAGDEDRRAASGDERGRDDDVERRDRLLQRALLLGPLGLGQLTGVAALARRRDADVEDLRPERADLLADLGPDVVAGDLRAEAAGGRDRLQAGDAGAEDEHARRADRARRGHEHREEPLQLGRGDQRRLVARDVRLRGERVHRLRAGDPRDRLHRQRGHPAVGEGLRGLGRGPRGEEADEHAAGAQARDLGRRRRGDLRDDVGAPRVAERRPRLGEELVGQQRARARAGLDGDRVARGDELAHDVRDERDAALAGRGLGGDADLHAAGNLREEQDAAPVPAVVAPADSVVAPATGGLTPRCSCNGGSDPLLFAQRVRGCGRRLGRGRRRCARRPGGRRRRRRGAGRSGSADLERRRAGRGAGRAAGGAGAEAAARVLGARAGQPPARAGPAGSGARSRASRAWAVTHVGVWRLVRE
jgi:hypothetical protein